MPNNTALPAPVFANLTDVSFIYIENANLFVPPSSHLAWMLEVLNIDIGTSVVARI